MSALTSLLVRDHVLSVRKIEVALEKQVTDGGDLESILLDMDAVSENVLSAYRAVLFGLLPGTRDEVMKATRDVVRKVPRDLAIKYHAVPLSSDGKLMVLAIAEPLSPEARKELQEHINEEIAYRVVTPVRVAAGLAHHYGGELDQRYRRLVEKLRNRAPGIVPYVAPPPAGGRVAAPTPVIGTKRQSKTPTRDFENDAAPVPPAPSKAEAPKERKSQSHWGPLDARAATKALEAALNRDDILELFVSFSKQFLGYVAVFVVQGDLASGKDALGPGAGRDVVRGLAVPLDVPGSFAQVRQSKMPMVGDLASGELDRLLVTDLGRTSEQPALLLPVVLRERVVLFLYGDRGGDRFTIADVPEVIGIAPRVADALQRLIFEKKGVRASGSITAQRPPPPTVDTTTETEPEPERAQRTEGTPRTDKRSEASPHAVLGVPRSAPPPPRMSTPALNPPRPTAEARPKSIPPGAGGYHAGNSPAEVAGPRASRLPHGVVHEPGKATSPGRFASPKAPPHGVVHEPGKASAPGIIAPKHDPESGTWIESVATGPSSEERPRSLSPARERPRASTPTHSARTVNTPAGAESEGSPIPLTRRSMTPASRPHGVSQRPDPRRDDNSAIHSDLVNVPEKRTSLPPTSPGSEPTPAPRNVRKSWRPDSQPPHRSKPRSNDSLPNVIVNMGESFERLVAELAQCGPEDESGPMAAVLKAGEAVLPVLVQRFPGPLWFDRRAPHKKVPEGRDISAVARAIVAFKDVAVPYVTSLLDTRDSESRFYAVVLASSFPHVEVIKRLVTLIYDRDAGVRRVALATIRANRSTGKPLDEALKEVRVTAKHGRGDVDRQVNAIVALGELQDRRSTPDLMELVASKDERIANAAHEALVSIARQDFGRSSKRWQQWYEKNAERHRMEWLMDALLHSNEEIRQAAGEELREASGQAFNFAALSSRRDRENALQRYREWWNREGYKKFT